MADDTASVAPAYEQIIQECCPWASTAWTYIKTLCDCPHFLTVTEMYDNMADVAAQERRAVIP
jgi:hypothetical protein